MAEDLPGDLARAADDAVSHLRALIRIDTTNPPGNERPAAEYVVRALGDTGIEATLIEPAPGRANVVARIQGDGSLPPLLLCSHLDVVTAEASRWLHPPFSGDVAEGAIWGRGAVDMKGMTAFQLATMAAIRRSGGRLQRDVIMLALADEEAGMTWGSKWMVDNEPGLIRAEYALNEVGGFTAQVGPNRLYFVGVAEKGVCWLRLRAAGESGHGSMPSAANAVAILADAVSRLARARLASRLTPASERFFATIAGASRPPASWLVRGLLHSASREASLRVLSRVEPEQGRVFRAMLHDTVTPTMLRAGTKENVIPAEAEAIIDGRVLPGATREAFLRQVRKVVGHGISVEVVSWGAATEFPADSPVMEAITAVTERHDPGARLAPWLNVGFTDSSQLARLEIRCYGYYPLRLPPDLRFAALFHGDNERVPIDAYRFGFRLFHDVVLEIASTSPGTPG